MLNVWKESYLDVRAKIEASGRDARWEFDRKKLFEKTEYMGNICQDLYNVAQVGTVLFRGQIISKSLQSHVLTIDCLTSFSENHFLSVTQQVDIVDIN